MATRVFVGKLSSKTTEEDLSEVFGKYGVVTKIDMKVGYAFVFFDDQDEAQEAIKALDNQALDGNLLVVENARSAKDLKPKPVKRLDLRLSVHNIDQRVSWQDLKDWAREAGDVTFANVFSRDGKIVGVIEFLDAEAMQNALRILGDVPLKGMRVTLEKEDPANEGRYERSIGSVSGGGGGGGRYEGVPHRDSYSGGHGNGHGGPPMRSHPYSSDRHAGGGGAAFYSGDRGRGGYEMRGGGPFSGPGGGGGPMPGDRERYLPRERGSAAYDGRGGGGGAPYYERGMMGPPPGYMGPGGAGYPPFDDRYGGYPPRYSEDYRRGGPPMGALGLGGPIPAGAYYRGGGGPPRDRSRSRERGGGGGMMGPAGGAAGHGPPPYYAGGGGGYDPRGGDIRGYPSGRGGDLRGDPRGDLRAGMDPRDMRGGGGGPPSMGGGGGMYHAGAGASRDGGGYMDERGGHGGPGGRGRFYEGRR